MRTVTTPRAMQKLAERWRCAGERVGVVPTMGALHAGHERLIRTARRECGRVVVTLFVNPTQFAPHEDLAQYPGTLAADKRLCRAAGVDALFLPPSDDIYPVGFGTTVHVNGPTQGWEGASRPTHFDGVSTIVAKLFNITRPHNAYFGQKDAQQAAVVRRFARDLNFDVHVRVCPTVREPDGLALSSRNQYLGPEERAQATCLYQALCEARALARTGERRTELLERAMRRVIEAQPLARPDYVGIVCPDTMRALTRLDNGRALAVAAAFVGETRLLDNMVLEVPA